MIDKSIERGKLLSICFLVISFLTVFDFLSGEVSQNIARLRACLHGVGDPGLVGLVSFVFTLWGTQNKRNLPH